MRRYKKKRTWPSSVTGSRRDLVKPGHNPGDVTGGTSGVMAGTELGASSLPGPIASPVGWTSPRVTTPGQRKTSCHSCHSLVGVDLGRSGAPLPRRCPDRWDVGHDGLEHGGVVDVGRGHHP